MIVHKDDTWALPSTTAPTTPNKFKAFSQYTSSSSSSNTERKRHAEERKQIAEQENQQRQPRDRPERCIVPGPETTDTNVKIELDKDVAVFIGIDSDNVHDE